LLRQARKKAGLSQTELARRAGVTQSVVSAYEAGRRQPSFPTLARLIEATGHDMEVVLRPRETKLNRLHGPLGRKVHAHRFELREAAAKHGATNLRVFGSVARGEESEDSDIDLLADLSANVGLLALGRLRSELEAILGASVDVVPADDLKPSVRGNVERDVISL
jgi:predicted nucleotidyltransferase/DNA-binding XRE family transcriptional regulator